MNQIVTVDHIEADSNIDHYRQSTDAASICKDIVIATAQNIQGRKYVRVEGWQAIATAHGCVASVSHVEKIEGGVRAIAEIRRMSDGRVINCAEGFVGEDEPTWYGGKSRNKTLPKRPDYAIRAMAQTRAISRACRSAFAHVVVLMNAGLETTPFEEVPSEGFDNGQQSAKRSPQSPHTQIQNSEPEFISNSQLRVLRTKIESTGSDIIALCRYFKIESLDKMPVDRYGYVIAQLDKKLTQKQVEENSEAT